MDCGNESEAVTGFMTMIEDHLALPFKTELLGVAAVVEGVDVTEAGEVVAICRRDSRRQAVPILRLPLPEPPPAGAEWIEAYRLWATGG